MPKQMWIRRTFYPLGMIAFLTFTCGTARADVYNITFADWSFDPSVGSRTFSVTSSTSPMSLGDYSNDVCFSNCIDDPRVDMSNGDPEGNTIHFTNGVTFNITLTDSTSQTFDLIRDDTGPVIQTFDLSTPFDQSLDGSTFNCGGDAFTDCGFKEGSLDIRFSGATVPEPSSVWLLLPAATAVYRFKRKYRA
jgi:hypothetical protein